MLRNQAVAAQARNKRKRSKDDVMPEAMLNCTFSFTVRRDVFNIPSLVVGNFLCVSAPSLGARALRADGRLRVGRVETDERTLLLRPLCARPSLRMHCISTPNCALTVIAGRELPESRVCASEACRRTVRIQEAVPVTESVDPVAGEKRGWRMAPNGTNLNRRRRRSLPFLSSPSPFLPLCFSAFLASLKSSTVFDT